MGQAKRGSNPWSPGRPVDDREGTVMEEGTKPVKKVSRKTNKVDSRLRRIS